MHCVLPKSHDLNRDALNRRPRIKHGHEGHTNVPAQTVKRTTLHLHKALGCIKPGLALVKIERVVARLLEDNRLTQLPIRKHVDGNGVHMRSEPVRRHACDRDG